MAGFILICETEYTEIILLISIYGFYCFFNFFAVYNEFERLLEEGAPLEAYSEWLEAMVERCVLLGARKSKAPVHKVAHAFLLTWSCFGTRVIRDMTLHSAPSFG